MMKIQKGLMLCAILLLAGSTSALDLETLRNEQAEIERIRLEQPGTPEFNFYTNLQSFAWGILLGLPGPYMPARFTTCWSKTSDLLTVLINAKISTDADPSRDMEELSATMWDIYVAFTNAMGGCYHVLDHIRNKVNAFKDLI